MTSPAVLPWREDFKTLDPAVWGHDCGHWAPGVQNYTDTPGNASANGLLTVTAKREADGSISSARLRSLVGFVPPVRIEASIRLPSAGHCFPAFWLLGDNPVGWPEQGEIDILEQQPQYAKATPPWSMLPTTLHSSVQGGHPDRPLGNTAHVGRNLSGAYHKYRVDWMPDSCTFYLDEVQVWSVTQAQFEAGGGEWVFDGRWPFYLLLNIAVMADDPGDVYPQRMTVDWIQATA